MSSAQNAASAQAEQQDISIARQQYGIALPALSAQLGSIGKSLGAGETGQMQQAFAGQRTNLTQGLAAQGGGRNQQAMAGGNASAALSPADVGAQLANALYGSKFQEGQANLNQQFGLMNMGLGGASAGGNAALGAAGNQLSAIGYLPNYNTTLANVSGAASGIASLYGAYNSWQAGQPGLQPGVTLPTSTSYPPSIPGGVNP